MARSKQHPEQVIERISEHSVDVSRLKPNGWVVDVGCRGFDLPRDMVARGLKVLAIDCDPRVVDPGIAGVTFANEAVWSSSGVPVRFAIHPNDVNAGSLVTSWRNCAMIDRVSVSIPDLMAKYKIQRACLLKLDCEGTEYTLLESLAQTTCFDQISVEFHDHCGIEPLGGIRVWLARLCEMMRGFYIPTKLTPSVAPWGGNLSHWDCLFTAVQ